MGMIDRQLVFEDFKDRVGNVFTPSGPGIPAIALTLNEAVLLPQQRNGPADMRPPFSLIFVGGDIVLPQAIYRLRHDDMGEVEIFLVPIGKDQHGASYQAVFN
jgi:hypothetical protein